MAGLYVHIPYCHSKCAYCDFYSTARRDDLSLYVTALERELSARADELGGSDITTLYIGGGTPSILPMDVLERLLAILPMGNAVEVTMEVNPEDITPEMSRFISTLPVNRVSMGVQSMVDEELKSVGRRHSADDVRRAVSLLRSAGINNLSLDLIYGLPGQTLDTWQKSMREVLAFSPEHLSAYSLMLEPGTRLWAQYQAGKYAETSQDVSEQMYLSLCECAASSGMEHYEISNFAMPGYRSVHNSGYWNLTPYLGLGASAHSFDGNVRRANPASLKKYLDNPARAFDVEDMNADERANEYMLLRLRTVEGLDVDEFAQRFGDSAQKDLLAKAVRYMDHGHMVYRNGCLSIPERHWLISDSILVELFR